MSLQSSVIRSSICVSAPLVGLAALFGVRRTVAGATKWVGIPIAALCALVRLINGLRRLRLWLAGSPGRSRALRAEVDVDEKVPYEGGGAWPRFERVALPSGGTLHMPHASSKEAAILFVPGKGQIFNLFPLQAEVDGRGAQLDIIGIDFIAYGAGFERNVRGFPPRLLYEFRFEDMQTTLLEAVRTASLRYKRILVAANSTAGLVLAAQLDAGGAVFEEEALKGIWLTNPVIAFKPGHVVDNIVRCPVPSSLFYFLDRVLGLGPVPLGFDENLDWCHYVECDREKGPKASMYVPNQQAGVMAHLPRWHLRENPVLFQYLSEVVVASREFEEKRRRGLGPVGRTPVFFSLNSEESEPHCGVAAAREMLTSWGARDAGDLKVHHEFCYDTLKERERTDAVLKWLVPEVLGVGWPGL